MGVLDGKVALVTAATSGIGRGIAEGFIAAGATVVINGRDSGRGRATLAEIDRGLQVRFVQGDVSTRDDCERLVDVATAWHGQLDILVNNAGGGAGYAPVHLLTDEAMHMSWVLNVMSTFWTCRRALPAMIARRHGRIINISSSGGKIALPAIAPYVAAKHAVNGLTKTIAVETATLGITSNAICPGPVETDMIRQVGPATAAVRGMTYESFLQMMTDRTLVKRMITPAEIAGLATLLASDGGSGITGQCINVDGGVILAC